MHNSQAEIQLCHKVDELRSGRILFLVSCTEMIPPAVRAAYAHCLVLHASDLPDGRGWSPHIWQIIEGAQEITLSLLEAAEPVDTGRIWLKRTLAIPKLALYDEINDLLFTAEVALIEQAIAEADFIKPVEQDIDSSAQLRYYSKRKPEDSELDIHKTLAAQFNHMRVADSNRFPNFFVIDGQRFNLKIEKQKDE